MRLANRTPEQYYGWAKTIGPNVEIVVKHQFERKYPTLGVQACESLVRLGKQYGAERLEAAAIAWHDYLGEPTVADDILDRVVHGAHHIELHGESLRRKDRSAPQKK